MMEPMTGTITEVDALEYVVLSKAEEHMHYGTTKCVTL